METWRTIPSFPDYQASSLGRIRRATPRRNQLAKPAVLRLRMDPAGYAVVTLMRPIHERTPGDCTRSYTPARVCRLVCEAFHGPQPEDRPHAAHISGDPTDNRAKNLRWASAQENGADQYRHGTRALGVRCRQSKLTDDKVLEARRLRETGTTWQALADRYSVSVRAVRGAVQGASWRHVQNDPSRILDTAPSAR